LLLLEITIVALVLLAALSIVWSTCRTGISPMPSSKRARDEVLRLVDDTSLGPLFELGSGWGGLLILLAKKYPNRKIVGYEVSFIPWLVSVLLKKILNLKNIEVRRKNFLQEDLSSAAVLICYLHPRGMSAISEKLSLDKSSANFLISNTFALPSFQPEKTVRLTDIYNSPIYFYRLYPINSISSDL